ncbi:hypothetical protein GCM10023183_19060 [Nibribacter koreensis]|uniref:Uncharacterized protein n=1 Tax=Nibribacter koreensis TaxID=1084519 RepID=A0ABP8FJB4_9BACT
MRQKIETRLLRAQFEFCVYWITKYKHRIANRPTARESVFLDKKEPVYGINLSCKEVGIGWIMGTQVKTIDY